MFEKSLYDLIRGLRNHKGNEKEYIQSCLKECRAEIVGPDNDIKATALLKLIYLEMFGHDMSWAAFHVIQVMSSTNYLQKRVGYLGAMQSFRTDTEVLILAPNLLKKDLTSTSILTISLPITTLPHIVTSSLALSTLQDLLPRMNHSDPAVRKKAFVTLYRLALVYPETLIPTLPKIKNKLVDENEDASVTAAIVNVVCELGWRRPQDFLPLAPRLFELLVNGGNNWMAIKLIKLFATFTPLEPRLIRKLLGPLTSIIRTTPAMSLQYECINGIIQGGILDISEESSSGEEIATLCVSKLRDMIMVEGDANLKFVAILAFNKIVITHPLLVAQQEDVIMECIDSPDLSIRLRILDLVVGMVNVDNLISIIGRLIRQLKDSHSANHEEIDAQPKQIEMTSDLDDDSLESMIGPHTFSSEVLVVPDDYKLDVISRILDMCSSNNYSNLMDFDWYINVLVQLIHLIPSPTSSSAQFSHMNLNSLSVFRTSERIGDELRNIAVKVRAVRKQVTRAAESVLISTSNNELPPNVISCGVLGPIGWIVGEFASQIARPESTLTALLYLLRVSVKPDAIIIYLHTIPKIFSFIANDNHREWTRERKTMISLLLTKIIYAIEPFTIHPDLEVQERAVEFSELLKLTLEASSNQEASAEDSRQEAPLLLTQALPSLFSGLELKSIAPSAQKNVPLPIELDLEQVINVNLTNPLINAVSPTYDEVEKETFDIYYHVPFSSTPGAPKAIPGHTLSEESLQSYYEGNTESSMDPEISKRRLAERMERHRDDPFYIFPTNEKSKASSPLQNLLKTGNGLELDLNEIPILELDIGKPAPLTEAPAKNFPAAKLRKKIEIAVDETLVASNTSMMYLKYSEEGLEGSKKLKRDKNSSLLQVDSSRIGSFSLDEDLTLEQNNFHQEDDAQFQKEMKEVEKKTLEMLRAKERIPAPQGVKGGTVVKKKKKIKPVKIESNIIDLESTQSNK